jgi:hypothetical protein
MKITDETLYQLLPSVYRIQDAKHGEPLKALITVIAEQAGLLEEDIARLHDNWFIETCKEWVVPYIGDLLGVRGFHVINTGSVFSQRARVANTLRYRRRKGTATMLEQLAHDTTRWNARATEFFELLGTTQHYNHIRMHNVRTPDLRDTNQIELLDTAFDTIAHSVDVRQIASGRGRHNIPNIGIFLWRLQSYRVPRVSAKAIVSEGAGRYTFDPLGNDLRLFNVPQTETEISHLAEEVNVAGLLRRRPLYDELEARRQALVDNRTPEYVYFDDREDSKAKPVLEIFLNDSPQPVLSEEVLICDLSKWDVPPDKKTYERTQEDGSLAKVDMPITVAVDPELGRLSFPATVAASQVQVSYAYGFSGDVGGGPYNREHSVADFLERKVAWQAGVSKEIAAVPGQIFSTLKEAVLEWNQQPPGSIGIIVLLDNNTYDKNLTGDDKIKIPEGSRLMIIAGDWPEVDVPDGLPGQKYRPKGRVVPVDRRPHLLSDIQIKGMAPPTSLTPGQVVFNGLMVEGKVSVQAGSLGSLQVVHSTLVPCKESLKVNSQNTRLRIDLIRSICGAIKLGSAISKLYLEDSIVDRAVGKAIDAETTDVELQKCTVLGKVSSLSIEAGNCIFTNKVSATRRQKGCMRFSYVPFNSNTPRRFRCQPDLEISTQIEMEEEKGTLSDPAKEAIRKHVLEWLIPSFTSSKYGRYAYGQLSLTCPSQIKTGADDGSEMGVFSFLKQPQREVNLKTSLDEHLRFGLEAGIIWVT